MPPWFARAPSAGWVRLAALIGVVGVLYANSLQNDFVWDDRLTALDPGSIGQILARPTGSYYRPVVMLTFKFDRFLWNASPVGYHLTNLAGHIAVAWLLGAYARTLGMSAGMSLSASLLFAAHPVQTEAVTYISGRTDILCALFVLLALLAWSRACKGSDRFAGASAAALCLALLSKESAVGVPLVLLAPGTNRTGRSPRPLLPLAVSAACFAARPHVDASASLAGLGHRLPAVGIAALTYLRLLIWPNDLHLERFTGVGGWSIGQGVAAWVVVIGLGLGLLYVARRVPGGLVLLALSAATYLPASGAVPVYGSIADRALFTPEHFLYLPLLGLAPLAAGGVTAFTPARLQPVLPIALAALLIVWGNIVIARNRDWKSEESIFRHTLRYDPPAARVWFNLGNLELAAGNLDEARRLFLAALARDPRDVAIHFNLAIVHQRLGAYADAEGEYERTIELDPGLVEAYRALAALLAARGEIGRAEEVLRRGLGKETRN